MEKSGKKGWKTSPDKDQNKKMPDIKKKGDQDESTKKEPRYNLHDDGEDGSAGIGGTSAI